MEGVTRGSKVSTWWKDINIIDPLDADGSGFDRGIKWKVGCGEKVGSIWHGKKGLPRRTHGYAKCQLYFGIVDSMF